MVTRPYVSSPVLKTGVTRHVRAVATNNSLYLRDVFLARFKLLLRRRLVEAIWKRAVDIFSQEQPMRGFGDFQRSQMRDTDPRVHQLFGHLRQAVDILEQLVLRPWPSPAPASKLPMQSETKKPEPSPAAQLGVQRKGSLRSGTQCGTFRAYCPAPQA